MATAYSYIRFSSVKQGKGDSARRQREWAIQWCEDNNHTLDTTLRLKDCGISAWKGKNRDTGALGEFLKLAKSGQIKKGSYLLVENLDRLSREVQSKALSLIQEIVDTGVNIVTMEPARVLTKHNVENDLGVLLEIVITGYRAHEESNIKSARLSKKLAHKRANLTAKGAKLTARGPDWLKLADDRKTWIKIPQAVATVKRAFKMMASGLGPPTIVKTFNREGVPPLTKKRKEWNQSSVRLMLKSRSVIGEFQPHKGYGSKADRVPVGEPIQGYYPQIVDDATFYKVQEQFKKNRRGRQGAPSKRVHNLFTGLLIDAENGSTYHVHTSNKVNRLVSYSAMKQTADYVAFPYEPFEMAFLKWTSEIQPKDILPPKENSSELEDELESLQGSLAGLNHKIEQIQKRMLKDDGGSFTSLMEVLTNLEGTKKETEEQIEALKGRLNSSTAEALNDTKMMIRQLAKSGDVDLRERLKSRIAMLVKQIKVYLLKDGSRNSWCFAEVEFEGGKSRVFWIKAKAIYGGKGRYEWSTAGMIQQAEKKSIHIRLESKEYRENLKQLFVEAL